MDAQQLLWTERYRPKTIDETILPPDIKKLFKTQVETQAVQNLLLVGPPGIGKTTVARALCEELEAEYIIINGSLSGNIDTLRNDITDFASSYSFDGKRKFVILDEADYLNVNSTQPALRNFVEEYAVNCGFILTCNYPKRIIEPLRSRFSTINFQIKKADLPKIAGQIFTRVCTILDTEGVEYEQKAVAELIKKYVPDWRRVINELQRYSTLGKIDTGILALCTDELIKEVFSLIKNKKWEALRKWVGQNSDMDAVELMRAIFDYAHDYMKPHSVAETVVLLGKYQYQAAFVADSEINLMACLTEIMVNAEFK